MTADKWAAIAAIGEIASAIFTFIGIITSLYMSIQALREVQADRRLRSLPYLAFEPGGQRFLVKFVKAGKAVPGIDSTYAKKVFSNIPDDAESVRIKHPDSGGLVGYGKLQNYGSGPAIHTSITWIPEEVSLGSDKFRLDSTKLAEPKYSRNLNTIPASPSHVLPGQDAKFYRLPTFIEKDFEKKITQVTGIIEIHCFDIFKQSHTVRQEFFLFTGYTDEKPYIHITFSDLQDADLVSSTVKQKKLPLLWRK